LIGYTRARRVLLVCLMFAWCLLHVCFIV